MSARRSEPGALPPIVKLFRYQQDWLDDWAKLKIACKSRQTGFTFVETLDVVMRCSAARTQWYYLTISEERAKEAIAYCRQHCEALGQRYEVSRETHIYEKAKFSALVITFPNGSRIVGLPSNPRTARGASGNVTFDEFAHQMFADDIWRAAAAIATWGYYVRILSTPNGRLGKYYDIWTNGRELTDPEIAKAVQQGEQPIADGWSRHWTDIYTAKAAGHPVDIEQARRLAGDSTTFAQEYCCEFLDEGLAWIPYELLESCVGPGAHTCWDSNLPVGPCFAGFDVARKRDLSVLWVNELRYDRLFTRGVVTMPQTKFRVQREKLFKSMERINRVCIDETGIGAQLAEETLEKFGKYQVEPVTMSSKTTAMIAARVRSALEGKEVVLPADNEIAKDLNSVRRMVTAHSNVSFSAPHTKDGHADRFWALGLALRASDDAPSTMAGAYESAGPRTRHAEPATVEERSGKRQPRIMRRWD